MTEAKNPMDILWSACGGFAEAKNVDEIVQGLLTALEPVSVADPKRLAELEAEIAGYDEELKGKLETQIADEIATMHRAAKADIVAALIRYGCPHGNADTMADAITGGLVPHVQYRMEWKGGEDD